MDLQVDIQVTGRSKSLPPEGKTGSWGRLAVGKKSPRFRVCRIHVGCVYVQVVSWKYKPFINYRSCKLTAVYESYARKRVFGTSEFKQKNYESAEIAQ